MCCFHYWETAVMADPDFRALCTELLSELEDRFTISEPADDPLIQRARAALAQPAPRPGDAIARIEKYIAERKAIRGLDPESIHTLHVGDDCREARLTISDLEALLSQPAPEPLTDQAIIDCLEPALDESIVEDHPEIAVEAGRNLLARWGQRPAKATMADLERVAARMQPNSHLNRLHVRQHLVTKGLLGERWGQDNG
jgi:hypothetical protein